MIEKDRPHVVPFERLAAALDELKRLA